MTTISTSNEYINAANETQEPEYVENETSAPEPTPTEDETDVEEKSRRINAKKIAAYTIAGLATAAACVAIFAVFGAAIFFLPLLGGAFAAKGWQTSRYRESEKSPILHNSTNARLHISTNARLHISIFAQTFKHLHVYTNV